MQKNGAVQKIQEMVRWDGGEYKVGGWWEVVMCGVYEPVTGRTAKCSTKCE